MSKFKTYFRLLSYYRYSWPLLSLVIILVLFSSFANIYGTFMLKDVINALELSSKNASDINYYNEFISQLLKMVFLYASAVLALFIYTQTIVHISNKVIYLIRNDLIRHTEKMSIGFFDKHKHGEIMSYFTNDISTLYDSLNVSFANLIFSFANIIGTIVCMFLINTYLSLIVCVFMAGELVFIYVNGKMTHKYYAATQKELANINAISEEDINGLKVIKAFNHKEDSFANFADANDSLRRQATNSFYHTEINVPVISSLSYFNFAISTVVGALMLVNGTISFGALSSYLVYVRQSSQPLNFFTQHINNILTALSGCERIFKFLDTTVEEDNGKVTLVKVSEDPLNYADRYNWCIPNPDGTCNLKPLKGDIKFNHVSFSYVPGKTILNDVSFHAQPGNKIAFVGPTGVGKTTIINLISRFYNIDTGYIFYDDINIKDIKLESLRHAISEVTQDTHLFTGTIKDNIRYVRMHSNDEEIKRAALVSNANSFISRLPLGYETILYDDGHNLSDGQRQLLSLARAALSRPPLLILDEATSNIDTHTEKLVNSAMDEIMQKRTVLVIAHRLSTVTNSDEIIVMEKGTIKEHGTHQELLNKKGLYYDLYSGKKELI